MPLDDATAAFVARKQSESGRPLHQMSVAEARALGADRQTPPDVDVSDALVTSAEIGRASCRERV